MPIADRIPSLRPYSAQGLAELSRNTPGCPSFLYGKRSIDAGFMADALTVSDTKARLVMVHELKLIAT